MLIHVPSWLLWMLLGGVTIPLAVWLAICVAEIVIAWWFWH